MAEVTMKDLLEAGVHFGHQTRRWNPQMKRFIFMERNGIYIIDLQKTLKCIQDARAAIEKVLRAGGHVLFVGTKKQAKPIIVDEAARAGMFYVTERWLGGMLTNFKTIRTSVKRLHDLDRMATDGTFEKLAKKEVSRLVARARAARVRLLGHQGNAGSAVGGVRRRHQEGEDRGQRGESSRHPDRRSGRHELRSRR